MKIELKCVLRFCVAKSSVFIAILHICSIIREITIYLQLIIACVISCKNCYDFFASSKNMSSTCDICRRKVLRSGKEVKCSNKNCSNISHSECLDAKERPELWKCQNCHEPTPSDLMRELKRISEFNKNVSQSLESCHEGITENNGLIRNLESEIKNCFEKIGNLTAKCASLEKENNNLKQQLNTQEQYTRLNCVEIFGVPELREENTYAVVSRIATAMNVKAGVEDIDCCHRLRKFPNSTEPRGIVVKFLTRWKKEEFLEARRSRKNLCLRDIGFEAQENVDPNKIVYMNESLTRANRSLLNKCREYKKVENIKYLWVRNGKILMRKNDVSRIYVITTTDDLRDVH